MRMGIREFRDNLTTIVREAKEPIVITNHDEVVGWFTPAKREPPNWEETVRKLAEFRADAEARGVDVAGIMKELGLEDDELFDDPWTQAQPKKPRRK